MKHVFVAADVNYAASKSSATQETATDPSLLADGAIGVYCLGVAAEGKLALVTAANDSNVGDLPCIIAVGRPADKGGAIVSPPFVASNVSRFVGVEYAAPVKQKSYIGYNGTSGDLNTPAAIANNDEALVKVTNVTDGRQQFDKKNYTGALGESATDYQVAAAVAKAVYAQNSDANSIVTAKVVSNGSITEATEDVTVTSGSKTVTFAGNQTVATDAYYVINGDVYLVATGVTAGTTMTLDRPYQGDTETIDVSATTDLAGVIATNTAWGIEFTTKENGQIFQLARDGVLEDATITYGYSDVAGNAVNPTPGSGTYAQVLALEKEAESYQKGYTNKVWFPRTPENLAVAAETYDLYHMNAVITGQGKDVRNKVKQEPIDISVAFPDDNNTANEGAATFEVVMNTILGTSVDITD